MNPILTIPVPQPFDFTANLAYLSRSPNECMYQIEKGMLYKRIPVGSRYPLFEVSAQSADALTVRLLEPYEDWNEPAQASVTRYVREWFDLDTDLAPFYAMAKEDEILNGLTGPLYGLRNMGIPDLFEAMCWGILGQQINLAFAYTLKRRFVETFGRNVPCDGPTSWVFPTPQDIAMLQVSDLTALQMTSKKSEYLIGVARLIAEGSLTKEQLLSAGSGKEAEKKLVAVRGIGPWTANYVLMRCLREPTAFPIDDVGLHNAIKHVLGMDRKPTIAEIKEMAKGWTNWEAYATFYLWRVLY